MFRTSRKTLYMLSGALWLFVGVLLLNTGFSLLMTGWDSTSFHLEKYSNFFSEVVHQVGDAEHTVILYIVIAFIIG